MASKYRNAGQTCVCANRSTCRTASTTNSSRSSPPRSQASKVGNGFEDGVNQGPLIEEAALEKVERHVADAVAKGGKVLTGGKRWAASSSSPRCWPTPRRHAVRARGNLRPVAPVFRFKTEAEAIDAGQRHRIRPGQLLLQPRHRPHLPRGRGAGIRHGRHQHRHLATEVPFGGVKQSGLGREGSRQGMDDYVEIKYLCLGDAGEGRFFHETELIPSP
jgi:succinate-semialdehyde dehydrogenase/glutarate-semialdehyde dehydrogenase